MKVLNPLQKVMDKVFGSPSVAERQAVEALIPKLADPEVKNRYAAQMELQDLASDASKPGNSRKRKTLGKVLAAKAADAKVPQPARVWIVRQLEYMGGDEAVPALAKLLGDKDAELAECARRALEKNPASSATAALRKALGKATDPVMKIGLINSLGERGDTKSVALFAKELGSPKTGPTAALALGKVANSAAVEALWPVLNKFPEAGEALINAAAALKAKGNAEAARAIYERLAKEAKSPAVRGAAETGLGKVPAGKPAAKAAGGKKKKKQ
ncbi:MAG: HEAT repeat domain-containing protein [Candidatus Sumerlaeia bacterium]|nr:HEAT repeat domain-containing protein [Candidatus Sumerlaeia bacterium]